MKVVSSVDEALKYYPVLKYRPNLKFSCKMKSDGICNVPLSPNIFLPFWGQSKSIAKDTLTYLQNLSPYGIKFFIVTFESGKLRNFLQFKQSPKESIDLKNKTVNLSKGDVQNLKRDKYMIMNCILKKYRDDEESDEIHPYERMIRSLTEDVKIPDGMYIFSVRDTLLVRFDGNHPWLNYVGGKKKFSTICSKIKNAKICNFPKAMIPIFNTTGGKDYMDIPIIEYESLIYINNLRRLKSLEPKSLEPEGEPKEAFGFQDLNYDWKKKVNVAIFRGGATGCGFDETENQRLHLAVLSKEKEFDQILDAGLIVGPYKKYIFNSKGKIGVLNFEKFLESHDLEKADRLSKKEQSNYKYILVVEGNVSAHRLATDMLYNSVILYVESQYTVWFQHMLKPYVHYVPIKSDFSDLKSKILWCQKNDNFCQKIAENARNLALSLLTYESLKTHITDSLKYV